MVNGNNIFISLDSNSAPFAATRANEIQVGATKIPISSPNTGEWEEHIVGRKKWGFSINSLVTTLDDIRKVLIVGNTYTITVYGREGSSVTALLQGRATCLDAKAGLTRGNLATGFFSFEGNGHLYTPVDITLNPSTLSLGISRTQQVTATVTPSTSSPLVWSSSNNNVATVSNSGLVTAVGEGTCTISCATADGSGYATLSCEVHPILVTGISLSQYEREFAFSTIAHDPITATVFPTDATNKHLTWTGNPSNAVVIQQTGDSYTLYAVASGTLTASATDGSGVSAICQITVT